MDINLSHKKGLCHEVVFKENNVFFWCRNQKQSLLTGCENIND